MELKIAIALFGFFLVSHAVMEVESQNESYFSERWRKIYSENMLANQPRWKLSSRQPADGAYEAREYEDAFWVSSHEPCWSQEMANSMGYVNLYFYLMGFNYQRFHYDLTYPIITGVKKNKVAEDGFAEIEEGKPRGGKRDNRPKQCPIKHTAMLYIPADDDKDVATPSGPTLDTERLPKRTVFVKEYPQNHTPAFCNKQAALLSVALLQDGVAFDENDWYCARYAPGNGEKDTRYEVWFVRTEE